MAPNLHSFISGSKSRTSVGETKLPRAQCKKKKYFARSRIQPPHSISLPASIFHFTCLHIPFHSHLHSISILPPYSISLCLHIPFQFVLHRLFDQSQCLGGRVQLSDTSWSERFYIFVWNTVISKSWGIWLFSILYPWLMMDACSKVLLIQFYPQILYDR